LQENWGIAIQRDTGKGITYIHPNGKKVRGKKLGEAYDKPSLMAAFTLERQQAMQSHQNKVITRLRLYQEKRSDRISFWTLDEFRAFIAVYKDDILYYTIFMMLFWTGMREGELLALTAADFNFSTQTISITKSYSRLNGQDLIQKPKISKSIRTITIPPFLCSIVQTYMNSIYGLHKHDRLFPITKHSILRYLHNGSQKAGVKKIRVHDLRHSHASFLVDQGFSPLVIKERLGHENIETTLNTYSHLYPSQQTKLLDGMEKLGKISVPKKEK
jgi:integrase